MIFFQRHNFVSSNEAVSSLASSSSDPDESGSNGSQVELEQVKKPWLRNAAVTTPYTHL